MKPIGMPMDSTCVLQKSLSQMLGLLLWGAVVLPPASAEEWMLSGAPTNKFWETIAASADGTRLVATTASDADGDLIYASTDSGTNWTVTSAPAILWHGIASSADGTRLLAVGNEYYRITNGYITYTIQAAARIYTSTNSGANWIETSGTPTNANVGWYSAASSADGLKLVVGASTGELYTSTNAGSTWTLRGAVKKQWMSISASADGTKLVAAVPKGGIYTSVDSGATWRLTSAPIDLSWGGVASSADGKRLVATAKFNAQGTAGGPIYVSPNAGTNWVMTSAPHYLWSSPASSADGRTLVAAAGLTAPTSPMGPIHISRDSGITWSMANTSSNHWGRVATSADGNKVFVGIDGAQRGIYWSQLSPSPLLSIKADGSAISWTIPSMNFLLQENSDFATTNWTDVATTPTVTNLDYQVLLPTPSGNRFYRLKADLAQ